MICRSIIHQYHQHLTCAPGDPVNLIVTLDESEDEGGEERLFLTVAVQLAAVGPCRAGESFRRRSRCSDKAPTAPLRFSVTSEVTGSAVTEDALTALVAGAKVDTWWWSMTEADCRAAYAKVDHREIARALLGYVRRYMAERVMEVMTDAVD